MNKVIYEVKPCVCDYGIYKEGKLISGDLIFNSRKAAEDVCSIMNEDINKEQLSNEEIIDKIPDEIKEEILKEYAEDLYEEFNQVAICEGKITMKDVADILQIETDSKQ